MKDYRKYSDIMKALSDTNRLAIMDMLSEKELCACKILEALRISQPTLSHHMRYLCDTGLVDSRKVEKWTYYKLNTAALNDLREFLDDLHATAVPVDPESIKSDVRDYYGKELKSKDDLKTSACCCSGGMSQEAKAVLPLIDDEILDRFYGCGSPIPPLLNGMTVLDLGCGTGRDVYIASKLVGETGRVIGVDMTPEQLEVARKHIDSQMERFGYSEPNVEFIQGYIEDLGSLGIEDGSVDVVISNCVINLSPEKERIFSEIHRVLRKGGELYFSDVFCDRRISDEAYSDPVIHGECLGGAMYVEDFRRMMRKVGFEDFRYTSVSDITIEDGRIREVLGDAEFTSRTVRAFKLDDLEDICEDYGQSATYDGSIPGCPDHFDLDDHHRFIKGEPMRVCGNTAAMVSETRYGSAFVIDGDRKVHYGKFRNCGGEQPKDEKKDAGGSCCCSCC